MATGHRFDVEAAVAADVARAVEGLFSPGQEVASLSRERVVNVLTDVAVLSFHGCLLEVEDFVRAFQLQPEHPNYPGQYVVC